MTEANIHTALLDVYGKIGYVQKDATMGGPGGGYKYVGEAAFIAALRPHMINAGIVVYPIGVRNIQRSIFQTKNGSTAISTCAEYAYRFVHAPSGTYVDVEAVGDGTDMGDKGAYKAATGAFKVALRQTFCIETGDDPDNTSSDDQARHSGGGETVPAEWMVEAQKQFKAWDIRFRDIPALKIRPEADGDETLLALKAWALGLHPSKDPFKDLCLLGKAYMDAKETASAT